MKQCDSALFRALSPYFSSPAFYFCLHPGLETSVSRAMGQCPSSLIPGNPITKSGEKLSSPFSTPSLVLMMIENPCIAAHFWQENYGSASIIIISRNQARHGKYVRCIMIIPHTRHDTVTSQQLHFQSSCLFVSSVCYEATVKHNPALSYRITTI